MDGRGRGRGGGGGGHCITYKFLGECNRGGQCRFRHEFVARELFRESLPIPEGMTEGMVIGNGGCNIKQLRSIAPCGVIVRKNEVLVGTDSEKNLRSLVKKMKLILSQEHVSGPSWTYIHPKGISSEAFYCFIPYHGRKPVRAEAPRLTMYELFRDLPMEKAVEDDIVKGVAAMNPCTEDDTREGLHAKLRQVHGDVEGDASELTWKHKTRIHLEPKKNVQKSLEDGLALLCEKREQTRFVTRLDARFGKVTWSKFPEEIYHKKYSIQDLAEILFEKDIKHLNIFNTDIRPNGAKAVCDDLRRCPSYSLETFDVKVTSIASVGGEEGTRLDARLLLRRGDDGRIDLKVLMVKKNEIKDVTLDILNLHRQHDVRIGLHHYQCVEDGEPLFGVVREMVGRISFLPHHKVRIQPKTSRWSVHLIRHKKKTTYVVDDKYAVTVADVSEHSFDVRGNEAVEFDLRKEGHAEVELHNLAWECAFGRDAGFPPDKALAQHFERGSVNTRNFGIIPHPWQVPSILSDFNTLWDQLEGLAEKLDGHQ